MPINPQNNSNDNTKKPDGQGFEQTVSSQSNYEHGKNSSGMPGNDRLIGTTIAERYKVSSFLGRGGMSTVYRAEHLSTKKIVALKIMHSHLLADSNAVRRFQQEATAASRLTHPNAIQVHDLGVTENGMPFLTMDYLEGLSLSELIENSDRRPSVDQSLDIFIQACDAIQEAHERGIIHRDIKPSNVMLVRSHKSKDREDMVKVLDFGIAKISQENSEGPKLTGTGEVFGSPVYMSPEQCLGKELDTRSDIYSMGCLMYEVLTGHPPLLGANVLATMYLQMNTMPKGLSKVDADPRLVKDLERIVFKALEKDPDKRYASMADLRDALDTLRHKTHSGFPMLANAAMSTSDLIRRTSNKLGPSKRAILSMMALLVISSGVTFPILAAGLWQKAPPVSERYINYINENHSAPHINNMQKVAQNEMIIDESRRFSENLFNDERPEGQFYTEKLFGEKLVLKHDYSKACECFQHALIVSNKSRKSPLLDVAQIFAELAYCRFQLGQDKVALPLALHSAKIFNYIDVCGEIECVNAFATIGACLENLQDHEQAMGAYLFFASYWDVFHDKFKERDPNRCATAALHAADFLARSELDFRTRIESIKSIQALISKAPSIELPADVIFSLAGKVQPALQAAANNPERLAEDLYSYAISIYDGQGSKGAFNAGAAYNNLGLLKLRQNHYPEALGCFKKAERFLKLTDESEDKSLALVKFSEADCQWRLSHYQEAMENAWTARTQWSSSKKTDTQTAR
ncbi:MAG: serine/threonine-protein kinase [Candidatus Obscuribacterales bacterium]|nr:serine/threonine-protein kinase [Candidatus Obscuribacterales bacterium]